MTEQNKDAMRVAAPRWIPTIVLSGEAYSCDVCGGPMLEAWTKKYGHIECCPQCAFERYGEYVAAQTKANL